MAETFSPVVGLSDVALDPFKQGDGCEPRIFGFVGRVEDERDYWEGEPGA